MRTAILAGGLRSSAPAIAFCFAEDGELAFTFRSLATGLLGRTALGEKKHHRPLGLTERQMMSVLLMPRNRFSFAVLDRLGAFESGRYFLIWSAMMRGGV